MDGSDSSLLEVPSLPDDALVQILSRLRAKSLCRCKCVSKPWRDLISDRLCCKDLPQTLQGFLYLDIVSSGGGDGSNGADADADADGGDDDDDVNGSNDGDAVADGSGRGDDDVNGSKDGDADADGGDLAGGCAEMLLRYGYGHGRFINLLGKPVSLLDPSFAFMKEPPGVEAVTLFDSCNGLLLFGHRRVSGTNDSLGYIVCNPVTEQWVAVPSGWTPIPPEVAGEWKKEVCIFLIFDPSVSSHFHLVEFWQHGLKNGIFLQVEGVHTYSSVTGLWSDRSSEWRRWGQGGGWEKWGRTAHIQSPGSGWALVNGMLHILIDQLQKDVFEIVAVDSQGRTCRIIEWPDQRTDPMFGFIFQSQGRLHCMSLFDEGSGVKSDGLSIWVLEDYSTEEWVLKHRLSRWHLFGGVDPLDLFDCRFLSLHTDGNMMFFVHRKDKKLISYDMDSREVRVLCTLTPGHGFPHVMPYVPSLKSL